VSILLSQGVRVIARGVWSWALVPARRLGLPAAVVVVLIGRWGGPTTGDRREAEGPAAAAGEGRVNLKDDEGRVRVILSVPEVEASTPVVLQDSRGNDLRSFTLHKDDTIDFSTFPGLPLQASAQNFGGGSARLSVQHGTTRVDHLGNPHDG
jgi:hypothetical protein